MQNELACGDGCDGIVIVGGSLSGLTLALACAKYGIRTRILERANGPHRTGGALAVDRALLARVTGRDPCIDGEVPSIPVTPSSCETTSWHAVQSWLLANVLRSPAITLIEGAAVTEVAQSADVATAITVDAKRIEAPAIVGADGYRSVVRAQVNPENPHNTYAGYVLWRGLVNEGDLPRDTRWPKNGQGRGFLSPEGYRLIVHPVPGQDGSVTAGARQLSFAWYDPTREPFLREQHCVLSSQEVVSSLDREHISAELTRELLALARKIWLEPWRTVVTHAIEHGGVYATPVAEYFPERLCRHRLAILGDAAHVASPSTGSGFSMGMLDAEALAHCLARHFEGLAGGGFASVLQRYEDLRLCEAQKFSAGSMSWSRAYVGRFAQQTKTRKQTIGRTPPVELPSP